MSSTDKQSAVYEQDWYAWVIDNAALLRAGRLSEIDSQHIAEELEDLGRSEHHALASHFTMLITHLLEWQHQPAFRGVSWQLSIDNARDEIAELLEESPSLRGKVAGIVKKRYSAARNCAILETGLPLAAFPEQCPFSLEQLLDGEFRPE